MLLKSVLTMFFFSSSFPSLSHPSFFSFILLDNIIYLEFFSASSSPEKKLVCNCYLQTKLFCYLSLMWTVFLTLWYLCFRCLSFLLFSTTLNHFNTSSFILPDTISSIKMSSLGIVPYFSIRYFKIHSSTWHSIYLFSPSPGSINFPLPNLHTLLLKKIPTSSSFF